MVKLLAMILLASVCLAQEKPTPPMINQLPPELQTEAKPKLDVTLSKVKIVERINILERQNEADRRQIDALRSQMDAANKKILGLLDDIRYRSGAVQALKLTVTDTTLHAKEPQ